MKHLLVLLAAAAAALVLAATASPARPHHRHHGHPGAASGPSWYHLSLEQKRVVVVEAIRRERAPLRWWLRSRDRLPASSSGPLVRCASVGADLPPAICVYAGRYVRAVHVLRRIDAKLAAAARARMLASFPPHHALWLCIHAGEGAWDDPNSGGNGHWGGLQMHPGWGYGTSYHASDDSQWTQEWAAERGYAASDYSSAWLNGQWGQTIGPCWGYAR